MYICFAPKDGTDTAFYTQYFEGGRYNREIYRIAQEGARNHGLLNVAVEDFFTGTLVEPSVGEQQKIAEILATCDRVIELKQQLLEEKRRQKQWLMQKLLSESSSVNEMPLSNLCSTICDGDWIESKDQSESGIRLIQTGNVGVGRYLDKDSRARYISQDTFERLHYFYDFLSKFPRNQNMYPVSYIFPYPLFLHRITSVERQKKQVHGPIFGHAPASFGY